MTIENAQELDHTFRTIAQTDHNSGIAGQSMWSLMNYGYTLKELQQWQHKTTNWHQLSMNRDNYLAEYKIKLKLLLSTNGY